MTIEQAVHGLTGVQIDLHGHSNRVCLTPDAWADDVVFHPSTVARGPFRRLAGPAGSERLSADQSVGDRRAMFS